MTLTTPCEDLPDLAEGSSPCPAQTFSEDLGWAIGALARSFRKLAAEAVVQLPGGLRGFLILTVLSAGQPPSQLALAQQLGFDKSAMTYLLDGLEDADLLTRRPDQADRRARQVLITAAGSAALDQARAQLAIAEQQILAPLGTDAQTSFRRALATVAVAALRGSPPTDDYT